MEEEAMGEGHTNEQAPLGPSDGVGCEKSPLVHHHKIDLVNMEIMNIYKIKNYTFLFSKPSLAKLNLT